MATILNASTSSGAVITPDTSGILQLQSNGTTVATLNSSGVNAGIQVASNAAPAFSAVKLTNQTISNATFTKIAYTGKTFDTANAFDSTTNYRFQPQVAGYYQLNALGQFDGVSVTRQIMSFYKNGSLYYIGADFSSPVAPRIGSSCIVYLNGSTDYMEMYGYIAASSGNIIYSSNSINLIDATGFQGCLIRSA